VEEEISEQFSSHCEMIARFVLETRGRGNLLSRDDYFVIDEWVQKSKDPEHLLLILSEKLNVLDQKKTASGLFRSLRTIRRSVLKKLREFKNLTAAVSHE